MVSIYSPNKLHDKMNSGTNHFGPRKTVINQFTLQSAGAN